VETGRKARKTAGLRKLEARKDSVCFLIKN
jgi:hypothetical protein